VSGIAASTSDPARGKSGFFFRPLFAPLMTTRKAAAALVALTAAQVAATVFHLPAWVCPFLQVTGIPCPGCGLSRACAALVTGAPAYSLRMHAFAAPVLLGVVLLLVAAVLPAPARLKMSAAAERVERSTGVSLLLLVALLVYWLARLLYAPGAFISLLSEH
jgi:hypothetical protein